MYFIRLAYVDICMLKLDWFSVIVFMVTADVYDAAAFGVTLASDVEGSAEGVKYPKKSEQ